MAGKEFSSFEKLEKYIKDKVNDCLNNEIAQEVKKNIQNSVSDVVYGAGNPRVYERRNLTNGSLGDIDVMNHNVNDGILEVIDNADFNHESAIEYGGFDNAFLDGSLAFNIEMGYGNKSEWYSKARPFMEKTVENMEKDKSHVISLKKGLEKRLGKGNVI